MCEYWNQIMEVLESVLESDQEILGPDYKCIKIRL